MRFNLKQSQEEHKNDLERLQIVQKFGLKMTVLICSFIFCSILIISFAFGVMTSLVGIIVSILAIILLTILSGIITRSAIV